MAAIESRNRSISARCAGDWPTIDPGPKQITASGSAMRMGNRCIVRQSTVKRGARNKGRARVGVVDSRRGGSYLSAVPPIRATLYGITDRGRTRDHNEDTFLVADLDGREPVRESRGDVHEIGDRGMLFLVADGMGGAGAGELASEMAAVEILSEMLRGWAAMPLGTEEAFAANLRRAVEAANTSLHNYATEHPDVRGMGTTATVAAVLGDRLYLAQIGDSRGYLIRDGEVRQLTRDQSLTQRLVEVGELTEEEAEASERRNIILQALGPDPKVKVDLSWQMLQRGDLLLLCSDGLSSVVRRDELAEVARSE